MADEHKYTVVADQLYKIDQSAGYRETQGFEYPKKTDVFYKGDVVDYSDDPDRGEEQLAEGNVVRLGEEPKVLQAPASEPSPVDNPDTEGKTSGAASEPAKAAPAKAAAPKADTTK